MASMVDGLTSPLEQELRLNKYKIYAAREFARVNRLNRVVQDSPNARFGIITSGKAYLDVMQALEDMGITEAIGADIGVRSIQSRHALAAGTAPDA